MQTAPTSAYYAKEVLLRKDLYVCHEDKQGKDPQGWAIFVFVGPALHSCRLWNTLLVHAECACIRTAGLLLQQEHDRKNTSMKQQGYPFPQAVVHQPRRKAAPSFKDRSHKKP